MNTFEIGQIFETSYPPEAALWCNDNLAYIQEIDSVTRQQERQELVKEEQYIEEKVIREGQYIEAVLDENGEVIIPAKIIPAEIIPAKTIPAEYKTVVEDVTIRRFQIVAIPEPTAEELAEQALSVAKAERAEAVLSITVEVDGMIFDGDEKAQERMARAVLMADSPEETIEWVLHDDTVAIVTAAQLRRACRLAGQAQTALWTKPYTDAVVTNVEQHYTLE